MLAELSQIDGECDNNQFKNSFIKQIGLCLGKDWLTDLNIYRVRNKCFGNFKFYWHWREHMGTVHY